MLCSGPANRGCRSAQPPANFWQASGLREGICLPETKIRPICPGRFGIFFPFDSSNDLAILCGLFAMAKLTVNDLNPRGKRVLMRVDYNVPMEDKDGKMVINDATRIEETLPTLRHLIEQGAKIILVAHLGRPKGKREPSMSLKPVAEKLSELLGSQSPVCRGLRRAGGGKRGGPIESRRRSAFGKCPLPRQGRVELPGLFRRPGQAGRMFM